MDDSNPNRLCNLQERLSRLDSIEYTVDMKKNTDTRFLERLLEPVSSALNSEAAQKLIGLKADKKTQAMVAKLAQKCNEGDLTAEERAEYETYVMVGELVALLQAKARVLLAQRGQSA
jgi:hypothetical protein